MVEVRHNQEKADKRHEADECDNDAVFDCRGASIIAK